MTFCAKCGKKLNEGAKFCPRCGTPAEIQGGAAACAADGKGASQTSSWEQAVQTRDLSGGFSTEDVEQNKLLAVLAYFSVLVILPILLGKESKYARFHANQGLVLLIVTMGWQFVSVMLNLAFDRYWWQLRFMLSMTGVVYLLLLVLFCIGVVNALNGKAKELPLIGGLRILR